MRVYIKTFFSSFQAPKMEALKGKMKEFNKSAPESLQLSDDQIEDLALLGKFCEI